MGGANFDYGRSLVQTSDGGFAVTGETINYGAGSTDMYIAKYDSLGNLSWDKTWGGTGDETGFSLVQTSDGGYAITGETSSYGAGSKDMFLAKYDSSGNLSWDKTWGGTGFDSGYSVVQAGDGSYAVAGHTSLGSGCYDILIAKYTSTGNLSWNKTLGGSGCDYGRSLVQTTDGGYAISGWISDNSGDMLLAKVDGLGNITGCSSPTCQEPTATTGEPTATTGVPTATTGEPTATTGDPTATTSDPTATDTFQTGLALWGQDVPITSSPLAATNTAGALDARDAPIRLRLLLDATKAASPGDASLKLQVSPKVGTCDASFTGETYADISGTNGFNYYNNTNLTDGDWIYPAGLDPTNGTNDILRQQYEESANFTNQTYISATGQDGLWDIALTANAEAFGGSWYFRVVKSDNTPLAGYSQIPELYIPPGMFQKMRHGQWFDAGGTKQPFFW